MPLHAGARTHSVEVDPQDDASLSPRKHKQIVYVDLLSDCLRFVILSVRFCNIILMLVEIYMLLFCERVIELY